MNNTLLDKKTIANAVQLLAIKLNEKYNDTSHDVVVMVVLNGAFMFAADLVRHLTFSHTIQFIQYQSYHKNERGNGYWKLWPSNVEDKDVIVVDDISDSGDTLLAICNSLHSRFKVASASTVTLLEKPSCKHKADYTGVLIDEDQFVFGYGMDNDDYMRNLPDIHYLNKCYTDEPNR